MHTPQQNQPRAARPRRAVLVVLTLLLAGCVVSAPSVDGWRSDAAGSLQTVAGELATAELVLGADRRGELFHATTRVLLVHAEEAAAAAVDSFEALQPPPDHGGEHDQISAALADGLSLVRQTRIAVAAGAGELLERLAVDLPAQRHALTELAAQLP